MSIITESEVFKFILSCFIGLISFVSLRSLNTLSKIECKVNELEKEVYFLKGQHDKNEGIKK